MTQKSKNASTFWSLQYKIIEEFDKKSFLNKIEISLITKFLNLIIYNKRKWKT